MKLTVFGATGGIGRALVEQSLAAGHDVTTVVRDPAKLRSDVHSVQASLDDLSPATAAALESAVAGSDAVLSAIGPRGRADTGIASRATRTIIRAMQAASAGRIVVVSAAPVSTVASPGRPNPPKRDPGEGFWTRTLLFPLTSLFLRDHYADLALMEDDLRASGLHWTSVRPPRLSDGPHTGKYRTASEMNVHGGLVISRADVADLMLASLGDPAAVDHALGCGY